MSRKQARVRRRWRSVSLRRHTRQVPITLLHRLAVQELPVAVSSGRDVDTVRVLNMAGHVKATIPKPVRTIDGYEQPPATVLAITSLGRSMLKRFPTRTR